jgi:adenine-specific DNA-methyltransferase
MTLLQTLQALRTDTARALPAKQKSSLGQFFTQEGIAAFMASLFRSLEGEVRLLDPGCGVGSLFSATLAEGIRREGLKRMEITAFEVDQGLAHPLQQAIEACADLAMQSSLSFEAKVQHTDFIVDGLGGSLLSAPSQQVSDFTHVIMNPPYKKIGAKSTHRQALRHFGLETVNLYTGFMAVAIRMLRPGGELVAIVPRSFCNGTYYLPFRRFLLSHMAITHLHVFEKRNNAFDDVLQENIILHGIKGAAQASVTITTSASTDFRQDPQTGDPVVKGLTTRKVAFEQVVKPQDQHAFIHILAREEDQRIVDQISRFTYTLNDLGLQVSTGPVVDFRLKSDLRQQLEAGAVPLLYPQHLNGGIHWPKDGKKPNAIHVSRASTPWLWANDGHFVITRRFSAKEEKRRVYASIYDASLPGDLIGFDNKLNVFHRQKKGLSAALARGLYVYLNSTLLDQYYRQFGGHTQVNATDLRNVSYPSLASLEWLGSQFDGVSLTQGKIDHLIAQING